MKKLSLAGLVLVGVMGSAVAAEYNAADFSFPNEGYEASIFKTEEAQQWVGAGLVTDSPVAPQSVEEQSAKPNQAIRLRYLSNRPYLSDKKQTDDRYNADEPWVGATKVVENPNGVKADNLDHFGRRPYIKHTFD